ncbi:MAG TPA: hypothetical protein VK438_06990 [Xanthobacteraceae bacterium]|nr:hypothetical protein [Xanthobacteraceae bacterium]
MPGKVTFDPTGGPYGLPPAQTAGALPQAENVEARLRMIVNDRLETVAFQMIPDVAEEFAAQLLEAVAAARRERQKR